jgi:bifunctional UDP-N-acetylglucosamine pyrophosphorylase/glucosamine-1-phosphate N-acetyltransferase
VTEQLAAVVLAAGEGKRFKSSKAKVLHELCGYPMLRHVLDAVAGVKPVRTAVVVGRNADEVAALVNAAMPKAVTALQADQLGTADATRIGEEALGKGSGDVLVVPGDTPLLTAATLRKLLQHHRRRKAAATVLTARVDDPTGYGRIVRDPVGAVARIVEQKDASPAERRISEINAGVWVFDRALLRSALAPIERDNAQKELYLTDIVEVLVAKSEVVEALAVDDAAEVAGVNSRAQLAEAAAVMRARIADAHMTNGVTIVDPSQTYIDAGVRIGRDTVVLPLTFLAGATTIGEGCEIGPGVRATNAKIKDGARVQFSVLIDAAVGARASVGPYAYLRPGARLEDGAKAGTFVEIKKSRVGKGSKVPHLSYIGDADIGEDVNIGAGTITCNYDGFEKNATVVGDGAFIGSDTMLVAPVRIGPGAVTAAGSTIAKDVPPGALGIERTEQSNVEGWADRKRARAASRAKGKKGRGAPR